MLTSESGDNMSAPESKLTVVVGSKNPVKMRATQTAFKSAFAQHEIEFIGVDAPSGVADQPMGDAETLKGARGRVESCKKLHPKADYFCGLEGGCDYLEGEMVCFAWMVVHNVAGVEGRAKAATHMLPNSIADLVKGGLELGSACDQIFKLHNSKQGKGCVGSLTDNRLTRQLYYERPMELALIPFTKPELFT
eukprot:m.340259 g.340259  ORF g.340259 m.340259 type:complete len:193 (+) comp19210_c0_seq1:70-648(+)